MDMVLNCTETGLAAEHIGCHFQGRYNHQTPPTPREWPTKGGSPNLLGLVEGFMGAANCFP